MTPLSWPSFWAFHQRITTVNPWALQHTGKLQSWRARQDCCTPSGILIDWIGYATCLANLFWVNVESCSAAGLNWFLMNMDKRHINQLGGLGRDIISTTIAMPTASAMGKHSERRSVEEEENVLHFLYQCPSLIRCSLFGSTFVISLTANIYWHQGYSLAYKTFWVVFQCEGGGRSLTLDWQFSCWNWNWSRWKRLQAKLKNKINK